VPTQCFVAQKAGVGRSSPPPKGRLQYVANLALKINVKVGGTNVRLLGDMNKFPVIGGGQPYMISAYDLGGGWGGGGGGKGGRADYCCQCAGPLINVSTAHHHPSPLPPLCTLCYLTTVCACHQWVSIEPQQH